MAAGLRDAKFDGRITLIGAEPEPPYERPHLSKGYLLGSVPREKLWLRPRDQYGAELMLGETAVELELAAREVHLASGRSVSWDVLCIATGSEARRLEGFEDALHLRELSDAGEVLRLLETRSELHIVGAGFIGCEVAAAATQRGCRVHVYEALEQPLARVLGPEVGAYLAAVHRAHGVELELGVARLPPLSGPVLVAVGSRPRTELAERAGLRVDRGIEVDEIGRTSSPGVFAAGDATRFHSPLYGTSIRVEHFQTAQRQGYAVGRAMAGGGEPYDEVPWFWSDQYDVSLQYAGAGLPWDEIVVRGELGRPPFAVFYMARGKLLGVAGVNDHHTVARARHVMQRRAELTREQMADPGFDLRRVLT